jgi:hypothetical protein
MKHVFPMLRNPVGVKAADERDSTLVLSEAEPLRASYLDAAE